VIGPQPTSTTLRRLDRRGVARIRPMVTALLAASIALLLAIAGERWYSSLRNDLARERVEREARSVATALESVIAHRMAVLHALGSFLRVHWSESELGTEFDQFASGLQTGTAGLRTLQYARDGVIIRTWPLEGNEQAIGRNVRADVRPEVAADFVRAEMGRSPVFSGPLMLFQGGEGVVGRLAVRDARDSLLGVAAVVMDFRTMLEEAGLVRAGQGLSLRMRNQADSVIWQSTGDGDSPDASPIRTVVELPDRTWWIEAEPMGGWSQGVAQNRRTYWAIAGAAILLVAGLAWALQAWQRTRIESAHLRDLQHAEETFRQLFQLVPDGVVVSRVSDGVILEVNDAYCRLVQQRRDSLIGAKISEAGVWASLEERERALAMLEPTGELREFPFMVSRRDGSGWEAVLSARRVQLHGEACNLAVIRDVHERVRLERRLAQSQRLEAVGRLAGGIAHDFNNLITGIRGYADLVLDGLAYNDPRRADLQEIQRASARAADLTRQLLTFARRQVVTPRLLDLNRLVRDAEPLLRRLCGERVALSIRLAPEPVAVVIDPAQFEQVLTNLTVNSRDAMPDGGQLDIRTAIEGDHAILAVHDEGTGISAEALPHIFEPFYTTKADGRGTGLGLATVYGIIEQAEGRLDVQSEMGVGTTMRVILPLASAAELPEAAPPASAPLPRGSETVLVVDDEPQIRELSIRLLGGLGYRVLAARDGTAALALLDENPEVALVLTDMVMPGMGGSELITAVHSNPSPPKVVLMSGYSEELVASGRDGVPFLAKPFTVAELAEIVRKTLDT
jgi:two-component system cell cycle sensor histidine kinase/response regulator CckA